MGLHPTHRTRISLDASTYDEICELCGATDITLGGWGKLGEPCPSNDDLRKEYDLKKAAETTNPANK